MASHSLQLFLFCLCTVSAAGLSIYEDPVPVNNVTSTQSSLTFAQHDSYLEVQPPSWPFSGRRELSFRFRTHYASCLLAYHIIEGFEQFSLKIQLENAKVKIFYELKNVTVTDFLTVGKGLNKNKWHHLHIMLDPQVGNLTATLDSRFMETITVSSLKKLDDPGIDVSAAKAIFYFGGLDPNKQILDSNYHHFVGCIKEIKFGSSSSNLNYVKSASMLNLYEGCYDRCRGETLCLRDAVCVNHFSHYTCDCFGTGYEREFCQDNALTSVTMYGNEFITYRIFDWKDRVHSELNRISISFKTIFDDCILFYGHGTIPVNNYIGASLVDGKVHVIVNFGDGEQSMELGENLNSGFWHTLTIHHKGRTIEAVVDDMDHMRNKLQWPNGHMHHLHFNPEIMIGGTPSQDKLMPGLKSRLKFVGNLRSVYYNEHNILREMVDNSDSVHHHGEFPVKYGEADIIDVPLTFSFTSTFITVPYSFNNTYKFSIDFKTEASEAIIISSIVTPGKEADYWDFRLRGDQTIFSIYESPDKMWTLSENLKLNDDIWHTLDLFYDKGEVRMTIDYNHDIVGTYKKKLMSRDTIHLGGSSLFKNKGFIGCMRRISFEGNRKQTRALVLDAPKGISIDNCKFVDPCKKSICEHGAKCSIVEDEIACDCTGTGYIGKTCHFSIYNRTCEELYSSGFRKSGIYKIDIDRHGPHPPSFVYCDMDGTDPETGEKVIKVQVKNNVPIATAVWNGDQKGFKFDVTYRDMTTEMLQTLIRTSKKCRQTVKYDCFNAPLRLGDFTWFKSANSGGRNIYSFGSSKSGSCKCGEDKSCTGGGTNNSAVLCNCDATSGKHDVDEGINEDKSTVGITEMYFLPPPELKDDSDSTITLGQLECIERATQKHSVKFKTKNSHIELPGWHKGDLNFSFKTTVSEATLFYQSSLHGTLGYLRISLIRGNSIIFDFIINDEPQNITITFKKYLNDINWHHVRIDNSEHHVMFSVDHQYRFIDLDENSNFGQFQGPVFIGGIPSHFLKRHSKLDNHASVGFQGCFQGLTMNDGPVELENYIPQHSANFEKGCQLSCNPNPCQNEGVCKELWSGYECQCANTLVTSGKHCETEPVDAVMFMSSKSVISGTSSDEAVDPLLNKDISITFRTYQKTALILYANDNLHNFIQIHIEDGNVVVFMFNHQKTIVRIENKYPDIFQGQQIKVVVQRSDTGTTLMVNDIVVESPKSVNLLTEYERVVPWTGNGEELLIVKIAPTSFTPPRYMHYFIGGVIDGVTSTIGGYIGCVQGFTADGAARSLTKALETQTDKTGLLAGCHLLCDKLPCKNQGICTENPDERTMTCQCSETSYGGEHCDQDVGGGFVGEHFVTYPIPDVAPPDTVDIRLSFSTDQAADEASVMLSVQYKDKPMTPLYLLLTKNGHLVIIDAIDSATLTKSAGGHYNDGHRHWLSYSRQGTDIKSFKVDGEEFVAETRLSMDTILNLNVTIPSASDEVKAASSEKSVIMIGGTSVSDPAVQSFETFKGCISNVFVKFDSESFEPFHSLYGYEKKDGAKQMSIKVKEQSCAAFAPIQLIPSENVYTEIPAAIAGTEWSSSPPKKIPVISQSAREQKVLSSGAPVTIIVLSIILAIIVICVLMYMHHINRRHKRRQFENDTTFFSNRSSNKKDSTDFEESYPLHNTNDSLDQPDGQIRKSNPPYEEEPPSTPIKRSSSQELEWDPGTANDSQIYPVTETTPDDEPPLSRNLASGPDDEIVSPGEKLSSPRSTDDEPIPDVAVVTISYSPALPPKTRLPPPLPPKKDDAVGSDLSVSSSGSVSSATSHSSSMSAIDHAAAQNTPPLTPRTATSTPAALQDGSSHKSSSFESSCDFCAENSDGEHSPVLIPTENLNDSLTNISVSSFSSDKETQSGHDEQLEDYSGNSSEKSFPKTESIISHLDHPKEIIPKRKNSDSENFRLLEPNGINDRDKLTSDNADENFPEHENSDSENSKLLEPAGLGYRDEPPNNPAGNMANERTPPSKKRPFSFFHLGKKIKPRGRKLAQPPTVCHPLSPDHNKPTIPTPLPSFINDANKQYDNPLSYLGGPHIDYDSDGTCSRRSSIKSVISLD